MRDTAKKDLILFSLILLIIAIGSTSEASLNPPSLGKFVFTGKFIKKKARLEKLQEKKKKFSYILFRSHLNEYLFFHKHFRHICDSGQIKNWFSDRLFSKAGLNIYTFRKTREGLFLTGHDHESPPISGHVLVYLESGYDNLKLNYLRVKRHTGLLRV